ncbi:O-acetyl-ADP-ribose deacetylase [Candidatus Lokiarchaeum ossiferum]|uniref:O-acetyl-ADP-ribose deacetylase n=1 Tax=Candidatus Lokiarchaeum ossiferum TaxID=2951803 RepID=A0ABY6HLK0_9ARCH|nr:O-acetyl-ADP-ribose deacetylase [Candidatus Lokiarchaeum sp. B-35]
MIINFFIPFVIQMIVEYHFTQNNIQHQINLLVGDITDQKTDAIVNAANEDLILGAGVAGAIRRKGGSSIQKECNSLEKTATGCAKITTAGNLSAKYVIHAVGPIFHDYSPSEAIYLLNRAVNNSLQIARDYNLGSISFPAISTGIYGFPKKLAAETIIESILDFLEKSSTRLLIQICLLSENDFHIFQHVANRFFKDRVLI